jgi:surfeit locus 1 family protein
MISRFSWKVSLVAAVLCAGMVRAAIWQWDRHLWKLGVITELSANLARPITPLLELAHRTSREGWSNFHFQRVSVAGEFDFEHEVVLRNRRLNDVAGFHVITPLRIDGSAFSILVDRGFIPIGAESKEARKDFQTPRKATFTGLIKESATPRLFGPQDGETGEGEPWVDKWFRVDVEKIAKQLPYSVLPVFLEFVSESPAADVVSAIVKESAAGRNEILMYTNDKRVENQGMQYAKDVYPIPAHDTTPPPDIHLGYVYEWSFMALLTAAIAIILQLPRPRRE